MTVRDERVSEDEQYVESFLKFSGPIERRLLQAVALLFVLLLLFQGLLLFDSVRERLTGIDRLEGEAYPVGQSFAPEPERVVY